MADPRTSPENKDKTGFYKSPFWTFEHNTLKSMLCMSFTILSNVFYYMNYLPEWATMIICALFFSIILTIIYMGNFIYGAFRHITNVLELWQNLWDPNTFNDIPKGPNGVNMGPQTVLDRVILCLYFLLYLIAGFWSAMAAPAFITFYTFIKALSATYVVRQKEPSNNPKDAPKMNLMSFIKNVLYYKKTFIIILVMLNLMGATNEYLGVSYMPGVIIAILILIFGMNVLAIDEPKALFSVLPNVEVPSLRHPPALKGAETNTCFPVPDIKPADDAENRTGIMTGQPINVLKATTIGGSKIFKGGRVKNVFLPKATMPKATKAPKVKMYNIQLV
jgi:hypothetical protein